MTTDLYFLLDASGSMRGREREVINHFNEYLDKHKALPEAAYLSVAVFSGQQFRWLRQWSPVADVPPLAQGDYHPNGSTPLNDSVAKVIDVASQNPDTGKLVIVITDGEENASSDYPGVGNEALKARIDSLDKTQWGFVYIGEGMSSQKAAMVGGAMNLDLSNSGGYVGMAAVMDAAAGATERYFSNRASRTAQKNLIEPQEGAGHKITITHTASPEEREAILREFRDTLDSRAERLKSSVDPLISADQGKAFREKFGDVREEAIESIPPEENPNDE